MIILMYAKYIIFSEKIYNKKNYQIHNAESTAIFFSKYKKKLQKQFSTWTCSTNFYNKFSSSKKMKYIWKERAKKKLFLLIKMYVA